MKLVITIDSDNEEMQIGADAAMALKGIAKRIEDIDGCDGDVRLNVPIKDINGNTVGSWSLDIDGDEPDGEDHGE